jgi:outer membrane protein TolC
MKRTIIILLFLNQSLWAQLGDSIPPVLGIDTMKVEQVMPVDTFMNLVRENHPLAVRARLIRERAEAQRIGASGAFDPKAYTEVKQKYFDDKTYYRLQDYGVEVPAWFGLSAKAGYNTNDGLFLNPENNLPQNGLWYADLSLTLGKGLFIDERRASLKQARLLVMAADFEIELALNQLFLDAISQYWEWYRAYTLYLTYEEAVELADVRLQQVKTNAILGELPMIDTLEASIQLQNRILSFQDASIQLTNARQMLNTFLWLDGQVPLELSTGVIPFYEEEVPDQLLSEDWLSVHPLLQTYDIKLDQLDIAQRLNREQLKPQLDLNYRFLNEAQQGDFFADYSIANYNWGLNASFPLFLRKERAKIQTTGVKIRETELELDVKARELQNKVLALQNEWAVSRLRLQESRRLVNNRLQLLQGEITRFQNGESSLFLINQRELRYLSSREKQIELEAKTRSILAKLRATAGELD